MVTMEEKNLIWIDLEFTGLDFEKDTIVEIATVITNSRLQIVAEGPSLVIHQDEDGLKKLSPWCIEHFTKSGLIKEIQKSSYDLKRAEEETLEFIKKHVGPKESPMCGNSVAHDRRFLYKEMPLLEAYFHYRHIDVSTIKELLRRWRPDLRDGFSKKDAHRAKEDILASIGELIYYRENFFKI
jgi:oligoribonuclease